MENDEKKIEWEKKQEFEDLKNKCVIYALLGGLLIWTGIAPIIFWYLYWRERKKLKELGKEIGEVIPW